jgi:hypothetical protein
MTQVPRGIEQDRARFRYNTQNIMQFKAFEVFIPEIFPLNIFGSQLAIVN